MRNFLLWLVEVVVMVLLGIAIARWIFFRTMSAFFAEMTGVAIRLRDACGMDEKFDHGALTVLVLVREMLERNQHLSYAPFSRKRTYEAKLEMPDLQLLHDFVIRERVARDIKSMRGVANARGGMN